MDGQMRGTRPFELDKLASFSSLTAASLDPKSLLLHVEHSSGLTKLVTLMRLVAMWCDDVDDFTA